MDVWTPTRNRALIAWIVAFVTMGGARGDDSLARSLRGPDLSARRTAALALRDSDNASRREAFPAMIETLMEEKDGQVRLAVLDALKALGPDAAPAIPALLSALTTSKNAEGREKSHQDYRSALALAAIGEPAVESLRGLLAKSKENVRAEAAMALGRIGPAAAPAVADLIGLLGEGKERIRNEAATALGRIGPAAIGPLIDASKHQDPRVREQAADALGLLSKTKTEARVETALLDRARDDVAGVRAAALKSLGKVATDEAALAPILAESLRDHDEKVRLAAVGLLAGHEPLLRRMVPDLEPLVAAEDPGVARHAVYLLSRTGPEAAPILLKAARNGKGRLDLIAEGLTGIGAPILNLLVPALADPDPRIRRVAALAIGPIRPLPEGIDRKLAAGLADPDHDTKLAFLAAIANLGPKARACLPEIRNLLGDGSPEIRVKAIEVLARSSPRDDHLVGNLMTAVDDTAPEVQKRALDTLRTLGPLGRRAIPAAIGRLASPKPEVRTAAAALIAGQGPMAGEAVPALVAMLESEAPETRVLAATTLGRLGRAAQPAFSPTTRLLEAKQVEVRIAAASVLGSFELEPAAIRPAIAKALADDAQEVRRATMGSIRKLGPQGATFIPNLIPLAGGKDDVEKLLKRFERKGPDADSIPPLIDLLKHEAAPVRLQAAKFLGLGGKSAETAIPALQRLREDPSDEVRKQAGTACEQIQGRPTTAAKS